MSALDAPQETPAQNEAAKRSEEAKPIPVVQLQLSVHVVYCLPTHLGQLDPRYEQLEVVLRPVVRYFHRDRRIMHLPLAEHILPFSASSAVLRGGTYLIDFDANRSEVGETSTSLSSYALEDAGGEGGEHPVIMKSPSAMLQFPCPDELKAVLFVSFGIRQRRLGFTAVRWITTISNPRTASEGTGSFSVTPEEVHRSKLVTRVVGNNIGAAICSVAVSRSDDCDSILLRLVQDKARLMVAHDEKSSALEKVNVKEMVIDGFSEEMIYRHMLLLADPEHYQRRVESLFSMYALNQEPHWWRESLLRKDYHLREEELLRRIYVEIGPECRAVSFHHRLWAFRKKYSLSESNIVSCLQSDLGSDICEVLSIDPEIVFAVLSLRFGREPLPTVYLFPPNVHAVDRRTFIFETLSLPIHWSLEKYRGTRSVIRPTRAPFTMSPNEQPLGRSGSGTQHSSVMNEVDMLRDKHSDEFLQIVPSIAAALRATVERNRRLPQGQQSQANGLTHLFCERKIKPQGSYQQFLHRLAELTFISPATLLGATILLDRLCMQRTDLFVTELNAMHLFLTSARVVSKVLELRSVSNRCFASVFGLNTKTLNMWEEFFIKTLNFDLCITPQEFREYVRLLSTESVLTPQPAPPASTQLGPCRCGEGAQMRAALSRKPEGVGNFNVTGSRGCSRTCVDAGGAETDNANDDNKNNSGGICPFRGATTKSGKVTGSFSSTDVGTISCLSYVNMAGGRRKTEPGVSPRRLRHVTNLSASLGATRQES